MASKKQKLMETLKRISHRSSWIFFFVVFQERRNRKDDGDEIFGQMSLKKIKDENPEEYTKLKI